MNRTMWLQERRMEKFQDVLGRFEARRLSAQDTAELPGMPEKIIAALWTNGCSGSGARRRATLAVGSRRSVLGGRW